MKFKKKTSLLVTIVLIGSISVGCNKKIDVETIRTNSPIMIHAEVANEIQAREDMVEIYKDNRNQENTESLEKFLSGLSQEEQDRFKKYADVQAYNVRSFEKEGNREYMNEELEKEINKLLNHMYFLPTGYSEDRAGTEDFKKLNMEETMFNYLKDNKITINELSKVTNVDFDFSSLPFKATISYDIKGKIGNKEFKETVVQNIYASPEDREVLELDMSEVNFRIDGIVTTQK